MEKILLIEPYYTGSHRQLIELLHSELNAVKMDSVDLITMTGKKWHWRARTSALHMSQAIPFAVNYRYIFASCVLPLHELMGLRPDLQNAKKIIYFHENQLVYPVRKSKDRDFQYGYNQILSCIAADVVIFNSKFNMESFLSNLTKFFRLQPDYRPKNLRQVIEPKCRVLYFPICFDSMKTAVSPSESQEPITDNSSTSSGAEKPRKIFRIVWPHRWEFDKNPELFFNTIYKLVELGITNFRLSILGESFTDNMEIFEQAKAKLEKFIDHYGYLSSKEEYLDVLRDSDIVISTAHHEFFGVAMMEAAYLGCFPLCPNRLVYPEIFTAPEYIYKTDEGLFKKLKQIFTCPSFHPPNCAINFNLYDWKFLKSSYLELFGMSLK